VIGPDFEAVLAAAQAGEDWALEAIYRDLAALVLGFCRGRGAADPEDVTGEVFVSVIRNLHRFKGDESSFRSWVFTIAHRRLVDERRWRARRPEDTADPDDVAAAQPGAGDAEEDALARLGDADVTRLLDGLTDDQRAVVVLRVVADLPVADVARILGKRPGAVKTLQRRALARLARNLDVSGRSGPDGQSEPVTDEGVSFPEPPAMTELS
jgi:RNA polymerase sigma-70 factor (ECF subfamily)